MRSKNSTVRDERVEIFNVDHLQWSHSELRRSESLGKSDLRREIHTTLYTVRSSELGVKVQIWKTKEY